MTHIDLALRCRPLCRREIEYGAILDVEVDERCVHMLHALEKFHLPNVFGPATSQEEVNNIIGRPMLQHALDGFSTSFICYVSNKL